MGVGMKNVKIYTDGACSGNPGPGGWGAILIYEGREKELSGYDPNTTNNRMELTAAIEALKALKHPCSVELYTDSAYLADAFNNGWIKGWKQKGWRNSSKEEVKNRDLWEQLDELSGIHDITWIKVKGHSDNELNNRCDKIAVGEIKKNSHDGKKGDKAMDYIEKTVSEDQVYKGNIINVYRMTVTLPDGRQATRDIVRHPGASAVIPINEKGEIYMVRQFRKPLDAISLEIPAGKLDPGEDPVQCAARELKEETGLSAGKLTRLVSVHSTPGFSDEVLHLFAATDLNEGESCADDDEFISTEKYTVRELLDMIMDGRITDAKSIIGIFLAEKVIKGEIKV